MSYSKAVERRVADDQDDRRELMCAAHGCPNIWTIKSSKLCRWHSASAPHMWPLVTQELQNAVTDAAAARSRPRPDTTPLSRADKTAILQNMRSMVARQRLA